MFIEVNGIELFYEKTGEGRPLVMVHGNGEDHSIFREASEVLGKDYSCYLVDSRNHGKSTKTKELRYEVMAEDMIAFMEALDLQDAVFYGFSDGGIIGLMAAAKCSRISTLIVSGANLTPDGVKPWLKAFIKFKYFFSKDPKLALMLNEPHIPDELLRSIKAQTLVLAGSRDLVTEEETRHIAETVPGAKLKILKGEGHGSYIVHKTKIAELIKEFVTWGQ
ncbi:MAG: alpha/beta hydrolase [Firmicutes bacterium]|nr:alpha/beta hydrolase [Bacillota bacterium]